MKIWQDFFLFYKTSQVSCSFLLYMICHDFLHALEIVTFPPLRQAHKCITLKNACTHIQVRDERPGQRNSFSDGFLHSLVRFDRNKNSRCISPYFNRH